MGDLSAHFSRSEFECKCGQCDMDGADIELVQWLEDIREEFGGPVHIHCANRCLEHNRACGSQDTSQHIKGKAVDFHIDGVDPEEIAEWIDENLCPDDGGVGIYDWGVHIDRRKNKARWDLRGERA